jgi:hypothetical protein
VEPNALVQTARGHPLRSVADDLERVKGPSANEPTTGAGDQKGQGQDQEEDAPEVVQLGMELSQVEAEDDRNLTIGEHA